MTLFYQVFGLTFRSSCPIVSLAGAMLRILNDDAAPYVGDKLPYAVSDETDYTLPVHGDRRGILHAGLEIRQDQIVEPVGQAAWATWLELLLRRVLERFPEVWSGS